MDLGVGFILELLRYEALWQLGDNAFSLTDCPRHAFRAGREHQFGAVGFEQLAPFQAHGFGHCQNQTVAFGRRNHR